MTSQNITLSKNGPNCLFLPANGIHYTAYQQFLNPLHSYFSITTHLYAPLFNENLQVPNNLSWYDIHDVMNANISNDPPTIGIGHSLGGTLLLYNAIHYPDRYKHLYIIEPAFFHPSFCYAYRCLHWLGLGAGFIRWCV